MQHKLATWAESDPNRRFDRLLRLIADREWLAEAARVVLASSGARTPGIEGIDKRRMQAGLDHHLADLRTNLLKGTYRPKPVKRIYIPKANGKLRPLGIPTLTDRIVQRAMLMAMEPIWESDFHRLSYGFRPERSVHHAVRTVRYSCRMAAERRGVGSSKVIWRATSTPFIIGCFCDAYGDGCGTDGLSIFSGEF